MLDLSRFLQSPVCLALVEAARAQWTDGADEFDFGWDVLRVWDGGDVRGGLDAMGHMSNAVAGLRDLGPTREEVGQAASLCWTIAEVSRGMESS